LSVSLLLSPSHQPEMMRAVALTQFGGPEVLHIASAVPRPAISRPQQLLVRVHAAALNRADCLQRAGKYTPPPGESDILGLELAGEVCELGTDAANAGWKRGDRMCALVGGGAYAEYAVVEHGSAIRLPDSMDYVTASALPETYLTAYQALSWVGRIERNNAVLIHAAASGVGVAATQLAKQLWNASVFATAGSHEKCEFARRQGADHAFCYRDPPPSWSDRVLDASGGRGVDVVVDLVLADYFQQNLQVMATDARLVILAALSSTKLQGEVDLGPILRKRLTISGSLLRTQSHEYKAKLVAEFWGVAAPLFADKRLQVLVDRVFSWHDVVEAHRYMEENKNSGKVVLRVD